MLNRRKLLTAIAGIAVLDAGSMAYAKGPHKHINGHTALGGKLKQNGKHEVGRAGKETVSAEVNNGKVVSMSAEARGVIRIMTGVRSGPRSGIGRVLRATKSERRWTIEEVGFWRS